MSSKQTGMSLLLLIPLVRSKILLYQQLKNNQLANTANLIQISNGKQIFEAYMDTLFPIKTFHFSLFVCFVL